MSEVNNGAEAAGFARLNFAPASSRDSIVHGVERAGMKNEFDKPGAIPKDAMAAWREFARAQGVRRGISLMTEEEMSWFPVPGLVASDMLPVYDHVDTSKPGAAKEIMALLRKAEEAGEKVVVHCCAGQHRTGMVLAAWLVERYGLSPEAAMEEMLAHAAERNVRRGSEPEKVRAFVEASM
ncbi:unnamed protein product [Polarella glacialis]|uniref:Tyrosine specific protein phosphatases domain-containing protein n=1 Tax=Polarella glacialis TaxID=89957 RepID=A0A813H2A0_POLGL|nr:unnamed protein product [Polarella glacialis]